MTTPNAQVAELMRLVDVLSDSAAEAEVSLQTGSSMHKKHLKERFLARSAVKSFARASLKQPAVEWLPLTNKLLAEISQEGARRYWLFIPSFKATGEILVGEFEWRQGLHPDGFNTSCGGRESANSVTHVMLYTTPLAPKGNTMTNHTPAQARVIAYEQAKCPAAISALLSLADRVDALTAERDALQADADRYRWLRDKSDPGICAFYLSVGKAFDGVKFNQETVDAAIDHAMKEPK